MDETGQLARWTGGYAAGLLANLAGVVAQLATTAEDKRQAREALLRLLAHATDSQTTGALAGGMAQLATTAEDKRQARGRSAREAAAFRDSAWSFGLGG